MKYTWHMAAKLLSWEQIEMGVFMCQILLPFLKQSCSKQGFSDLVMIRRMGTPLHFLSKIIVLLSVYRMYKCFFKHESSSELLRFLQRPRQKRLCHHQGPMPFQSQTTPNDESPHILWLPPLSKWSGKEGRFIECGRPGQRREERARKQVECDF